MKSTLSVLVASLLLVCVSAGAVPHRRAAARQAAAPSPHQGVIEGPLNEAMVVGPPTTLRCRVQANGERVQWTEYGTNPDGALISDMDVVLPGHPNRLRYTILGNRTAGEYDLYINPTEEADGTLYECADANAPPPDNVAGARLTILKAEPNCTDTLPGDGIVMEGDYHTSECFVYYTGTAPTMTWTGPGPINTGGTATNVSVWSGISFFANRSMSTQMFTCRTHFTAPSQQSEAINTPTYQHLYRTVQMFVYWPPKNVRHSPDKPTYEVGEAVTCEVDSYPMSDIRWQSMKTNEWFNSSTFVIRDDMILNQTMRCRAENVIQGETYVTDYFFELWVNVPPTTPTPGLTTTTTAPPAEADCFDLTGKWVADSPRATMCLWVAPEESGVLYGIFKNDTDTFYVDLYGKVQLNTWEQGGFSLIFPGTLGLSGHVLECRRCHGTEILTVSQIKRAESSVEQCGEPGTTWVLPDLTFYRAPVEPPCAAKPSFSY